jgi:hypothetical protein
MDEVAKHADFESFVKWANGRFTLDELEHVWAQVKPELETIKQVIDVDAVTKVIDNHIDKLTELESKGVELSHEELKQIENDIVEDIQSVL